MQYMPLYCLAVKLVNGKTIWRRPNKANWRGYITIAQLDGSGQDGRQDIENYECNPHCEMRYRQWSRYDLGK